MALEILKKKLKEHGMTLSPDQEGKFLKYAEMLEEANRVMNLTAVKGGSETEIRHFIDSIAPLFYLDGFKDGSHKLITGSNSDSVLCNSAAGSEITTASAVRVADLGTGAGFPGIPLAIMLPDWEFVLIDSLNKRIGFLEEVIKQLQLNNVSVCCGRLEEAGRRPEYRERFDIVVSRAVADLRVLIELAVPFAALSGSFISYKGENAGTELEMCGKALAELNCSEPEIIPYKEETSDINRNLVVIRKIGACPDRYPRRTGVPAKRPL